MNIYKSFDTNPPLIQIEEGLGLYHVPNEIEILILKDNTEIHYSGSGDFTIKTNILLELINEVRSK